MKGLILKDLMTLKKTFKSYLLLFIGYLVIDFMGDQSSLTLSIAFIIATMIPIATINYDERSKWDKLVNTMPFSRKDIVLSKYLLGFILMVVSLGATFLLNRMPMADRLAATSAMGMMCLVYQALLIPVLFKFGSEKGRIIMMVVLLVPFAVGGMLAKAVDFESMSITTFLDRNFMLVAIVTLAVTAVLYVLSMVLSVKIYSGKEF